MIPKVIQVWHEIVKTQNTDLLDQILADDARMHSPVVHTVQEGREITKMYLCCAAKALCNDHFHYLREIYDDGFAMLEFETVIDGITINGVDMISWNSEHLITDFKVMARPLKGINTLHHAMGKALEDHLKEQAK